MTVDRVEAAVSLTPAAVRLDSLRMDAAGGVLTAEGGAARTAAWPGRLEAAWTGLDLDRLLRPLRPDAPAVLPATVEGSLSAEWTALEPRAVTLSGESRLNRRLGGRRLAVRCRGRRVAPCRGSAIRRRRARVGRRGRRDRTRGGLPRRRLARHGARRRCHSGVCRFGAVQPSGAGVARPRSPPGGCRGAPRQPSWWAAPSAGRC